MTETKGYFAAFRCTSKENGHAGIITWSRFDSKKDFDDFWKGQDHSIQEIVEEGITSERAVELVQTTPHQAYINAAIMDSRHPVTGDFHLDILEMKLQAVSFMRTVQAA